ncbi:hypothetical protein CTAYLR_001112 [Chrysophaeum taylorii]|uniref:Phospholipase/carboxylesterase/thioesterase domain-containing protein n=1 Tax=Chrysophaeum taylorii TaxID=2483200 RepID=A0AAD7UP30_9STRA|nr:hypothetical protein CTAYLR_001112 [Chrysophaeum taylorii]
MTSIEAMSIKELKALITSAGLSFAGCSEKSELRDRAREAAARLASRQPTKDSRVVASWATQFEYWNGGGENDVDLAVVLLHGIGASPDDLVPLASALAPGLDAKCLFVFPGAPNSSWWPLDPAQWMMQAMAGEASLAKMIRTEFPGLADCRVKGAELLEDVRRRAGPRAKIALGGFSQGAMTSTDIALSVPPGTVDAVCHISGAPIVVDTWSAALETRAPSLKVYLSHGRSDFVLPFAVSGWTKSLFEKAGVDLTYVPHDGGHTPGPLEPLVAFLNRTLDHAR